MILIIAEKPKQARDYANALGGFTSHDGYLQSKDYYISWCVGHLIEMERDDVYREKGYWNKSYLPILPETFQYKVSKEAICKKQVSVIKELAKKSSSLINATDADREGELIFLYVYDFLKLKLPFKRLWISSLTDGDIKKGFSSLVSSESVKNLGKSAYQRAIADWLVGVNCTQAATLQFGHGKLLTIGRVQTAILKIICERYLRNINHTKVFTYRIQCSHQDGFPFFTEGEILNTKEEVTTLFNGLKQEHILKDIDEKKTTVSPPLLYNLDDLIIDANKIFGISAQTTQKAAQSLYEKKITSYPRTDSNYINEENFDGLKSLIPKLAKIAFQADYSIESQKPKSVNSEKLTGSHDAIVPVGSTEELDKLTNEERIIFYLIVQRCMQSFSLPAEYDKKKYIFDNNGSAFLYHSSKTLKKGWKNYNFAIQKEEDGEESDEKEKQALNIQIGDSISVLQKLIKEIESKPLPFYTDATLTKDLVNIKRFLEEEYNQVLQDFDTKDLQIGTPATRPDIIKKLFNIELLELVKKKIVPTEKGLSFYNTIKHLKIADIATTAVWEYKLKQIADGSMNDQTFSSEIKSFVRSTVEEIFASTSEVNVYNTKDIGKCPKCEDGRIIKGKKAYGCTNWKNGCDFTIWMSVSKKTLTEKNIKDLLEKKKTGMIKGFTSSKGSNFDAYLVMRENFKIEFEFGK